MPLHDYITQVYKEVNDPSYIIRFIDYLVSSTKRRVIFTVNERTVTPLITGVLEDIKTKERFYSLAQFYNSTNGSNIGDTDTLILKRVNVSKSYTLWRLLCSISEKTILEFFDQKYRSFLLYRDVRRRIKLYTSISTNNVINLRWNDEEFVVNHTKLECKKHPFKIYDILEAYEDGYIRDLYYCKDKSQYMITGNY
jgi:hypothetical protein